MFERETKREKILESRQRELRLKERTQSQQGPRTDEQHGGGKMEYCFKDTECRGVVGEKLRGARFRR